MKKKDFGELYIADIERAFKEAQKATETRVNKTIKIGKLWIQIILWKY